ncbi:MAG: hypothetical protein ACFFD4_01315 [Candidatus Odinarchaeota archaeon]
MITRPKRKIEAVQHREYPTSEPAPVLMPETLLVSTGAVFKLLFSSFSQTKNVNRERER